MEATAAGSQQSNADAAASAFKERVQSNFFHLVQQGLSPNDAAVKALSMAKEVAGPKAPLALTPPIPPIAVIPDPLAAAQAKYGPLCLGLAGPFQSICIVGEPRPGKKCLVLDIDHTLYDPSDHGGSKAAVVTSNAHGFYDESVTGRCRPRLHEFLTEVYQEYDIMVWSASQMKRILTLLQQLGVCAPANSDYRLLAVLDKYSMSERSSDTRGAGKVCEAGAAVGEGSALVQTVTVPPGATGLQQIEARSSVDDSVMVVTVPPSLGPGDVFYVSPPGAVSSVSEEYGIEQSELQLALQLSMDQPSSSSNPSSARSVQNGAVHQARSRRRYIKPLSLIWACREFSHLYTEKNTVIVDDTLDVCGANPHNFIQCTRYSWRDHATDNELPRLARYLTRIAQAPEFPASHECWREGS